MNRDQRRDIDATGRILADPDTAWSAEAERREALRQEKHLSLLGNLIVVVVAVLIVVGGLLYYGWELPPRNMSVMPFDSTGYSPPPRPLFAVAGSVPRTGVEPVLPNGQGRAIPAQAAALKSPLPATEVSLRRGAVAYANNCAFCHGSTGQGNGPVSEHYTPGAPSLLTARVQSAPPGALFYQITNGILSTPLPETQRILPREWHSFKGTTTTEDRWAMVAFMKALGKGADALVPPPDQTTFPQKTKTTMPGTTSVTGAPSTDMARPAGLGGPGIQGLTSGAGSASDMGKAGAPGAPSVR